MSEPTPRSERELDGLRRELVFRVAEHFDGCVCDRCCAAHLRVWLKESEQEVKRLREALQTIHDDVRVHGAEFDKGGGWDAVGRRAFMLADAALQPKESRGPQE